MSGAIGGRGAQGPPGPQGPAGASATVGVGTVSAQPADLPAASVENVGTAAHAVLNFAFQLPKGDSGPAGPAGPQGAAGPTGPAPTFEHIVQVTTLPAGYQAYADIEPVVGQSDTYQMLLGIPRGAPGEGGQPGPQGPQGETGPQGPQGETGEQGPAPVFGTPQTGAAGTDVTMTGSGTADSPFILTIPRGATGATGPSGPTGPAGGSSAVYQLTSTSSSFSPIRPTLASGTIAASATYYKQVNTTSSFSLTVTTTTAPGFTNVALGVTTISLTRDSYCRVVTSARTAANTQLAALYTKGARTVAVCPGGGNNTSGVGAFTFTDATTSYSNWAFLESTGTLNSDGSVSFSSLYVRFNSSSPAVSNAYALTVLRAY